MRANGSIYVAVVFALLAGYFSYQWWYNPRRVIKRQLGELAATLSVPADAESEVERINRIARLRTYFAPDVRILVRGGDSVVTSRDQLIGLAASWTPPPGGWHVELVDVQVSIESDATARALMTVEVTTKDPATGEAAVDARDAIVDFAEQEGAWVITTAEPAASSERR
jgi:hypothetical protein